MAERRKESRKALAARAEVIWKDQDGVEQIFAALLEDSSPGGVSFRVKRCFRVGSELKISWHNECFVGVTKRCRKDAFDYVIHLERQLFSARAGEREMQAADQPAISLGGDD